MEDDFFLVVVVVVVVVLMLVIDDDNLAVRALVGDNGVVFFVLGADKRKVPIVRQVDCFCLGDIGVVLDRIEDEVGDLVRLGGNFCDGWEEGPFLLVGEVGDRGGEEPLVLLLVGEVGDWGIVVAFFFFFFFSVVAIEMEDSLYTPFVVEVAVTMGLF